MELHTIPCGFLLGALLEAENKPHSSDLNTPKPWGALGGGCSFPDAVLSYLEASCGLTVSS